MPRLSIVIPVIGAQDLLDDTLVSVLENRPANCEIVVVHNRPYSDPYDLAGEVLFVRAPRRARMAECLDLALASCSSPVVHVLTCGVEVNPGWADAALRCLQDSSIASVAAVVLHRNDLQDRVSMGLEYRVEGTVSRVTASDEESSVCGADTLAAFYRTSVLKAIGGFGRWATEASAAADVALALRSAELPCEVAPNCLARADVTVLRRESAFQRGRDAERLFWRWASRHGIARSVVSHALLLVGETVCALWRPSLVAQLTGRGLGAVEAIFSRRRPAASVSQVADGPSVIPSPHFAMQAAESHYLPAKVA